MPMRCVWSIFGILGLLLILGCQQTHVMSLGTPDWSPWVGVNEQARVDIYKSPDLVKGESNYRVFSAGEHSITDTEVTLQLDEYIQYTNWNWRTKEERPILYVVALFPTVCILDKKNTHSYQWLKYDIAWSMSDELFVVFLESTRPPQPLVLEPCPDGRSATIEMAWGKLLVLPDQGEVRTAP